MCHTFLYISNIDSSPPSVIHLRTYSSIETYNSDVTEIGATKDKYIPLMIVDEEYTLDYINNFSLKYFNIKEPYDLKSPSDTFLEDEIFKTITDDDDDGF